MLRAGWGCSELTSGSPVTLTGWIASAVSVCILSVLWKFHSADHDFRGTHTHSLTLPPMRPSFEGVTAVPIQQMLHDMEQAARLQPETSLTAPPDALMPVSSHDA